MSEFLLYGLIFSLDNRWSAGRNQPLVAEPCNRRVQLRTLSCPYVKPVLLASGFVWAAGPKVGPLCIMTPLCNNGMTRCKIVGFVVLFRSEGILPLQIFSPTGTQFGQTVGKTLEIALLIFTVKTCSDTSRPKKWARTKYPCGFFASYLKSNIVNS